MKKILTAFASLALSAAMLAQQAKYVTRQATTPGTAQTGNINISGNGIFAGVTLTGATASMTFPGIANPDPPAPGFVLLHGNTIIPGVTRLEIDNEFATNVIVGRDTVIVVKNDTGSTLTRFSLVYASGADGSVPTVALADSTDAAKMPAVGVVLNDILDGDLGQVLRLGIMENLDLSNFSVGDTLYVDPANPGVATTTRPVAPNIVQAVALILSNDAVVGEALAMFAPALLGTETGTRAGAFEVINPTPGDLATSTLTVSATDTNSNLSYGSVGIELPGDGASPGDLVFRYGPSEAARISGVTGAWISLSGTSGLFQTSDTTGANTFPTIASRLNTDQTANLFEAQSTDGLTVLSAIDYLGVFTGGVNTASLGTAAHVAIGTGVGVDATIELTAIILGIAGNSYTIELVAGVGIDIPLSTYESGTVTTVVLGTDGAGDLDPTKNTATLVLAELGASTLFTGALAGTGADSLVPESQLFFGGAESITTAGGANIVGITHSSAFQVPIGATGHTGLLYDSDLGSSDGHLVLGVGTGGPVSGWSSGIQFLSDSGHGTVALSAESDDLGLTSLSWLTLDSLLKAFYPGSYAGVTDGSEIVDLGLPTQPFRTIFGGVGLVASASIGSGTDGTVNMVSDTAGLVGNGFTVEVVEAAGADDNSAAAFVDQALTVTLGKTGGVLDPAKNTATIIAGRINTAAGGVTATASGTGADPLTGAEGPTTFTGGAESLTLAGGASIAGPIYANNLKGVTVSGTTCTITAITNGIITAATCTP